MSYYCQILLPSEKLLLYCFSCWKYWKIVEPLVIHHNISPTLTWKRQGEIFSSYIVQNIFQTSIHECFHFSLMLVITFCNKFVCVYFSCMINLVWILIAQYSVIVIHCCTFGGINYNIFSLNCFYMRHTYSSREGETLT